MSDTLSKKINIPLPFSVETALPLDYNSTFTSFNAATAAALSAVEIGGVGSKNYFGQLITVSDSDLGIYKTFRITTEGKLREVAATWYFKDGVEETIDESGNSWIGLTPLVYGRINVIYASMIASSADWNTTFTTVRSTSGNWEWAYENFSALSALATDTRNTFSSVSGKWNSNYLTVNSLSARWNSAYNTVNNNYKKWNNVSTEFMNSSSGWENVRTHVESTSANNESVYSTVYSTSSTWNAGVNLANEINSKISTEASTVNKLADKAYVDDKIQTTIGVYRGSFATWSQVPTTSADYNSDSYGRRTPQQNDFIIVIDDSANETTVTVESNPIGRKTSRNVIDTTGETVLIPANTILTETHIALLESKYISAIYVFRKGSWRYRYVGVWSEGTAGKNNWKSEYQINDTSFTEQQLAALNSGITHNKTVKISENTYNISQLTLSSGDWNKSYSEIAATSANNRSVFTTVNENSGDWETVSGKVDTDYLKYYAASAWNILTNEDTDYTNVPVGLIFIYEEDAVPTPITGLSIYSKNTGILKFSSNITYDPDFGILMIGGNSNFNQETLTLTIPGSSDVDEGTKFNSDDGVLSLSNTLSWNETAGILVLSDKDSFNASTGVITMYGSRTGDDTRTQFTVTNHLQNTTNSNTAQFVHKNGQYVAIITPNTGYQITTITCTMGGVTVPQSSTNTFSISNVTGDIVITAYAEMIVTSGHRITNVLTHCSTTNPLTSVEHGSSYSATITAESGYVISSRSCIMDGYAQPFIGNTITIDYVTNDVLITVVAVEDVSVKSTFYTTNSLLKLGSDTSFADGTLTLGGSVSSYDGNTLLVLRGNVEDNSYVNVTNTLNNVTTNNPSTRVIEGTTYSAKLTPSDSTFEFSSKSCTVGSNVSRIGYDGTINIPSVSGDIAITASAVKISRSEYLSGTDGILSLPFGTTFTNNTITLPSSVKFNTSNNTLEMRGILSGGSYCKINNNLTNVINNCTVIDTLSGSSYSATLTPSSGYVIQNAYCYMGDELQTITNGVITIPSVTADIEINATAVQTATFYTDSKLLKLGADTTFSNNILTFGSSVSALSGNSVISIQGSAE